MGLGAGVLGVAGEADVDSQSQSAERCIRLKQCLHLATFAWPTNALFHKVGSILDHGTSGNAAAFAETFYRNQAIRHHHIPYVPPLSAFGSPACPGFFPGTSGLERLQECCSTGSIPGCLRPAGTMISCRLYRRPYEGPHSNPDGQATVLTYRQIPPHGYVSSTLEGLGVSQRRC